MNEKTLVVFYSRKGYVREYALRLAREKGYDFLDLETALDTVGYNGFHNCVAASLGKKETVLFPYETDIKAYGKVIFCTPVWCGTPCSPIKTFIAAEKHRVENAEYVIFHALPGQMTAVADEMDKLLRLKRERCVDIQCLFGKYVKEQEI